MKQPEDSILLRHWQTEQRNKIYPQASTNIFMWSVITVFAVLLILI